LSDPAAQCYTAASAQLLRSWHHFVLLGSQIASKEQGGRMASTIWKGYVTFGLISIPVRVFAAARTDRVSFHQVHEPCQTRIKQQLYCPTCDRVVERSELVKGYEAEKNNLVIVEEDELKKIAPASRETMDILEFVKLQEVDPLYFDASYYVLPEDPGKRAYQLLVETMEKTGYAAMAKLAMHQREYTVIIRARAHGLTLHTIYYANEVREVPGYGTTTEIEVKPQEIQLAEQLIKSLATTFDAEKYEDAYQKRVLELIEAKSHGRSVTETKTPKLAPVIDLMAALQRSLEQGGTSERKPAAHKTSAPRKTARAARKAS
jgi:DNA end-binding protein Ku